LQTSENRGSIVISQHQFLLGHSVQDRKIEKSTEQALRKQEKIAIFPPLSFKLILGKE
jgi:hypothetical protein